MSVMLCSSRKHVLNRWQSFFTDEDEIYIAESIEYLHSLCSQFKVTILLLDGSLISWTQLRKLCSQECSTQVLLVSDRPSVRQGAASIACGCSGYANTYIAKKQLDTVLENLRIGKIWLGRDLKEYLLKKS